ncbi:MAG: hypothetical protein LBV19_11025 [Streptococcaceae bacterium]|jgi:ABC-2 type transport system permease protein|nr:hypothetical protein [Streptococcaceae bacterium]
MIKILIKNLSLFNNLKTILVSFLVGPFFNVLFFFLISPRSNASVLILTALILSATSCIISVYAQIYIHALDIGILKEIFVNWKAFLKFNGAALLIANLIALLQSFALFMIYLMLNFKIQISFQDAVIIILLVVLFSSLFAMLTLLASLTNNNPYFFSNLITGLLPIISATIIPITSYPAWLQVISKILPFWTIQNVVWENQVFYGQIVLYFSLALSLLGVVLVKTRKKILHQ